MTRIALLDSQAHRSLKVDARASAAHGDNQRFVRVSVSELPHLIVHYPVLFSKNAQTGAFFCGAMLGFDPGENLFLEEWAQGGLSYRPLMLQRGPFQAQGPRLAIDLDDPRVGAEGGTCLFTEQGEPTAYLQSVRYAFTELKSGLEATQAFIVRLLELTLIEPIDMEAEFDDGTARNCVGLYTVNQEKLSALPDATVVELFRRGYLRLMHLMIASRRQFALLARRKNRRILEPTEGLAGVSPPRRGSAAG
ncbi:MAG: SapC family protein [Steroidobacteraceae bacterium]